MKDIVIRLMRIIIGLGLMGYVAFLYNSKAIITENFVINLNIVFLILIAVIALFIFIMGVKPLCFSRQKTIQTIFGIFLILFSYYFLKDNASVYVYISDILILLGVFLTIAGPTGFCITENCKKKVEESKIEIIEV